MLNSPIITIYYDHQIEGNAPEPIYRIPKSLAMYFSPVIKDCFPSRHTQHVSRDGCDGQTKVTVSGVVKPAYTMLLEWMLSSGKEDGRSRVPRLPFAKYARLYEVAELLQVHYVRDEMLYRMNRIAVGQVPADDVRMVYAAYPKNHFVRQIVIRSIGDAVLSRTLRHWALYLDIRTDIPAYDYDISEYTTAKKLGWKRQQEELEGKSRKNRRPRKNWGFQGVQPENWEYSWEEVPAKSVAAIARKGKGARSTYYKLAAIDFGVSRW